MVRFLESSVLAFGLSDYWKAELDIVGCQWDDPELGLEWDNKDVTRSCRDTESGTFQEMLVTYKEYSRKLQVRSPDQG